MTAEDLNNGKRNWDYRYSWLRDSAFTVYALLRLGFTDEADHYVDWLSGLLRNRNADGSLQIMCELAPFHISAIAGFSFLLVISVDTIHGGKDIPELELPHLDGHKGQKPVRIGNGAADHLQLDIYGEIIDSLCVFFLLRHARIQILTLEFPQVHGAKAQSSSFLRQLGLDSRDRRLRLRDLARKGFVDLGSSGREAKFPLLEGKSMTILLSRHELIAIELDRSCSG